VRGEKEGEVRFLMGLAGKGNNNTKRNIRKSLCSQRLTGPSFLMTIKLLATSKDDREREECGTLPMIHT